MKDTPTVYVLIVDGVPVKVYMEKAAAIRDRDINRKASTPFRTVVAFVKEFKVTE